MRAQRVSAVVSAGFTWKRPRSASDRTVTGLCSAKGRSQLGIVETGTNALEANVRGNIQMNPPDCAASTLRTASPMKAEIQEKAKLIPMRTRIPSMNSKTVPCGRNPTRKPTISMMATVNPLRARSATVRPLTTADEDMGSDRKAIDQSLLHVLGQANARDDAAEGDGLDEDPRHQVVDVLPARHLDGAPEHVAEKEHEHDRLDGDEHDQLGRSQGAQDAPPGEDHRVEERPDESRPSHDRLVTRSGR